MSAVADRDHGPTGTGARLRLARACRRRGNGSQPAGNRASSAVTSAASRRHRTERVDRQRRPAARLVALGHVPERRHRREGHYGRPAVRLTGNLDGMARQEPGTMEGDAPRPRRAPSSSTRCVRSPRRTHKLGNGGETVAQLLRTAVNEVQASPHPDPDALKERISWLLERVETSVQAAHWQGYGAARQHRRHRALRRPVRHRVGHHEQLHRHLERAHHEPRRGRAWHRRGAARDRARPVRRHSGGRDLQRVRPRHRRLSCAARGRFGLGDAAGQP